LKFGVGVGEGFPLQENNKIIPEKTIRNGKIFL
jgi:hypothetical protein